MTPPAAAAANAQAQQCWKPTPMPIDLPNATPGAVVTRFPPEPSWYLDIGHCKAALMNQYIAEQFKVWLLLLAFILF